jgi:radical SAM protein with 4Fe4S-binding SPASM domain
MTGSAIAPPFLVALNLTRRCNLRCAHCYLDASTRADGGDELSTAEALSIIDQIAGLNGEAMVVLTGGEPLMRPDITELARRAGDHGLMVVMGTNATLLNDARVEALQRAGVRAVGISLDSLEPEHHDRFRGLAGAWARTMAGIDACRRGGLMFQVHFSVTDDNAAELDDMIAFCRDAGAAVLNVFFLVCTGRGERVTNISAETYDLVLRRLVIAAREEKDLVVRARCAPHFRRMALEADPPLAVTSIQGYDAGGCMAGKSYCRVTPDGELTACPYMEASVGSLREARLDDLWRTAPLFEALRAPRLEGRCGVCAYSRVCGGCRARPAARDGAVMGEDFLCTYQPGEGTLVEPRTAAGPPVAWTADAEARIGRVPAFVRRFVRARAEEHARGRGKTTVTAADLDALARRRFGDRVPSRPPSPAAVTSEGGER